MDSGIVIVSTLAIGIVIYFWAMSILLRYVDEHSGEKAVLWVGLTDVELAKFSDAKLGSYDLCLEVEAKLRKKNT